LRSFLFGGPALAISPADVARSVAEEEAWQEFWTSGDGGEAVGGAQRHKLAARWAAFFSEGPLARGSSVIVDIAAGRGVALAEAMQALRGAGTFLALDYSPAAAAAAQRALSPAIAAAADAALLPLRDRCADAVISQYGVEYAGVGAFSEAARILTPGGRFCSISHFRGGAIELECAENERLIAAAAGPSLFNAARRSLAETFRRREQGSAQLGDAGLDRALAAAVADAARRVASAQPGAAKATLARFLDDLTRLSARRLAYDEKDALGWLAGMEASLGAYQKRMQSMRAAALDQASIDRIGAVFAQSGLVEFRAAPLHLDESRAPAAWVIEARRPD
jgi:SAM-dependent methyltransferase